MDANRAIPRRSFSCTGFNNKPYYTGKNWIAIRIRYHERYVGEKMIKLHRRWAPPKLFGVQYASVPCTPRPLYVGVIVLNGFYCSSRIICKQSVRHTIYIEAIFVIVPVVFTLISSLSTCEVGPFPAICSMNHTDEQDMLQEQDRLHLSSVNLTKAEDNRSCFCLASTMGSMWHITHVEGSKFSLK